MINLQITSDSLFYFSLLIGLILMTTTFLFKLSAAPFHNWAPDLYDSLPTSLTMYLAIIPKIAI